MTSTRDGQAARSIPSERSTRPFPIVISGPSGVGKGSIAAQVLERETALRLSVSVTTRQRRVGEVDGREYAFVTHEEFDRRRAAGDLAEWAEVHGYRYGTPRVALEGLLSEGYEVLLDIDYQGGLKIRESYPEAALIFILPPSWQELEARLRQRRSDPETEVRRRLDNAARELVHAAHYDYFVVNTEVGLAVEQVRAILAAERQRVTRLLRGLSALVAKR